MEIKSRADTQRLKDLIRKKIKKRERQNASEKESQVETQNLKKDSSKLICSKSRRSSSIGIRSKSRSLSRSADRHKLEQGVNCSRIIIPKKVETNNSLLFESFEAECHKLPGSDNFIKTHQKLLFSKSIATVIKSNKRVSNQSNINYIKARKKKDLAHDQVYSPNFDSIKARNDINCIRFDKQQGRPANSGIFAASASYYPLPVIQSYAKKLPLNSPLSNTRFAKFDQILPREHNINSKFPAWMQKGYGNRHYLKTITEKTLEANCHIDKKPTLGQSMPDLRHRTPRVKQVQKKQPKDKDSDTSSSDLDDMIDFYNSMLPIHQT